MLNSELFKFLFFLFVFLSQVNYTFNEQVLSFREPGLGWIVVILALQFVVINIFLVLLELKYKINFNRFVPRLPSWCCHWSSFVSGRQMAYRVDESRIGGGGGGGGASDAVDAGVRSESFRIQMLDTSQITDPVVVKGLVRKFKKNGRSFAAVNNINFGIAKGECFGLVRL